MKYSLTTQGVSNFMESLYELTSAQLLVQADAVKSDFRKFLTDHFVLTLEQKSYLSSLPDKAVQYFGDQCWFCFLYKLDVSLDYPNPPAGLTRSKYVEAKSSAKLTAGPSGDPTASGELVFSIAFVTTVP